MTHRHSDIVEVAPTPPPEPDGVRISIGHRTMIAIAAVIASAVALVIVLN